MSDEDKRAGLGPFAVQPSRTQKKKAAEAVQKMGEQLLTLDNARLDALELPSELREALIAARDMRTRGARRRQIQYIGALMRRMEVEPLQQHLAGMTLSAHEEARRFKQVESWRDELMAGDLGRRDWLVESYARIDPEQLTRLIQAAGQDKAAAERRKAGKALFRYLRQFTTSEAGDEVN